jgi:hypothetical protein
MMRLSIILGRHLMSQSPRQNPVNWSEIGVAVMLAGVIVFGVIANGRTLLDAIFTLAFGAVLLVCAWLSQWTIRQAQAARQPTPWGWVWQGAFFILSVGATAAAFWWGFAD